MHAVCASDGIILSGNNHFPRDYFTSGDNKKFFEN